MRAGFILGDWNSPVIGFLDENASVAGLGESPDIVWTGGEWFEFRSIGAETGEFRLNEGNFFCAVGKGFSSGASDLGAVKESLSEVKPAAGCALELVREKVGVLNSESG